VVGVKVAAQDDEALQTVRRLQRSPGEDLCEVLQHGVQGNDCAYVEPRTQYKKCTVNCTKTSVARRRVALVHLLPGKVQAFLSILSGDGRRDYKGKTGGPMGPYHVGSRRVAVFFFICHARADAGAQHTQLDVLILQQIHGEEPLCGRVSDCLQHVQSATDSRWPMKWAYGSRCIFYQADNMQVMTIMAFEMFTKQICTDMHKESSHVMHKMHCQWQEKPPR